MNDYINEHLPEVAEMLRTAWEDVLAAAGEVSRAEAARKRAESVWEQVKAKSNEAARLHFAANTAPPGVAVPADLLARVAAAVDTQTLEWNSGARGLRETASKGAVATVHAERRDRRAVLLVRTHVVEATRNATPRWARVAKLEIWADSGTIAGSGGRKRVVSEEDCAALLALTGYGVKP